MGDKYNVPKSSTCITDVDRESFHFGCTHDVKDIDSIESLRILNPHRCKPIADYLPHIGGIDCSTLVFYADRCYLWKGEVKNPKCGSHRSPYFSGNGPSSSIVRCLFTYMFNAKLEKQQLLRHMCPLITGEFNSGMCCNPLHLRPGTPKENSRDIRIHALVKDLLGGNSTDYFCFEHNTTTISTVGDWQLDDRDWRLLNNQLKKRNLTYCNRCTCDVINITLPHVAVVDHTTAPFNSESKLMDRLMEEWEKEQQTMTTTTLVKRKYDRKKTRNKIAVTKKYKPYDDEQKEKRNVRQSALREKKKAENQKKLDTDVIYVTAPVDRPPLDAKQMWEEYMASNPIPTGMLPKKPKHKER